MSVRSISVEERRLRLITRHRLTESARTDDVATIARDLVALHSSDPTSVYLSTAARMANPSVAAIQQALYTDKTVVRLHAMRRTLWVQTPRLALIAHAATTSRYLKREEERLLTMLEEWSPVDDGRTWLESARETVLSTLEQHPGISTRQIGELLPELRVPIQMAPGKSYASTQSALSRLMLQLGFEARVIRREPSSSWINSQYRWDLMERWLPGGWQGGEPADAREALIESWLKSFGPGTVADIVWWTGLPKGMVEKALVSVGAEEVDLDGVTGFVSAGDSEALLEPGGQSVALLPGLDPTTMGWRERSWYLNDASVPLLFDRNGNAGPTIWFDGEIVGGWVQGPQGEIRYRLTLDRGQGVISAIDERCALLEQFWDEARFKVRFPAPLQMQLFEAG